MSTWGADPYSQNLASVISFIMQHLTLFSRVWILFPNPVFYITNKSPLQRCKFGNQFFLHVLSFSTCFHLHSSALGLKERGFYLIFYVVVTTVFREGWLQTIISIIGQTNLSQAFNSTHFTLSIHLFLSPRPLHFLPVTCVLPVAPIELILAFVLNHLFKALLWREVFCNCCDLPYLCHQVHFTNLSENTALLVISNELIKCSPLADFPGFACLATKEELSKQCTTHMYTPFLSFSFLFFKKCWTTWMICQPDCWHIMIYIFWMW